MLLKRDYRSKDDRNNNDVIRIKQKREKLIKGDKKKNLAKKQNIRIFKRNAHKVQKETREGIKANGTFHNRRT